jgi:hypothetical protein
MMAKSKALPFAEAPDHLEGWVGNAGFDPMGLSSPQNIRWMREAEIQHGRLCQLAWFGWVMVDLGMKFPGAKYEGLTSWTAHDAVAKYASRPLPPLRLCPRTRAPACAAAAVASAVALQRSRSTEEAAQQMWRRQ